MHFHSTVQQTMSKDKLFSHQTSHPGSFEFNDDVAEVFPDMLARSIPGYGQTITAIGALAARYVQRSTRCYDLGCSLGAATLAMREQITVDDCEIVAIDSSAAMVKRCRDLTKSDDLGIKTTVIEGDIRKADITNASMVVMNYTLQFIPISDRLKMIKQIFEGMLPGGVFVLSEKVADEDPEIEQLLVDLHHDFKKSNAYSELEISRKRAAIENVLVPEATRVHVERLSSAGFEHCGVWLRQLNFISMLAIK